MRTGLVVAQSSPVESQEQFFGWHTVAWSIIPFVIVIALALSRRKKAAPLPHVTDATFEEDVLRSEVPVLVHFYRTWSIGDQVMIKQASRLAERNGERLKVVWLDTDLNPQTMARFPHVETPAFLFFFDGRCLFHCEGVVDEADVDREMWDAQRKHLRRSATQPPAAGEAAL